MTFGQDHDPAVDAMQMGVHAAEMSKKLLIRSV